MKKLLILFLVLPILSFGTSKEFVVKLKSDTSRVRQLSHEKPDEYKCIEDLCYIAVDQEELEQLENEGLVEHVEKNIPFYPLTGMKIADTWAYRSDYYPDYEKGRTVIARYNNSNTPFVAAVIDSGIVKNTYLYGVNNDYKIFHEITPGTICVNIAEPGQPCYDNDGHGTHVAGIISSYEDGKYFGTGYGSVKILPYVTQKNNSKFFMYNDLLNALRDILAKKIGRDESGNAVDKVNFITVNMSLGTDAFNPVNHKIMGDLFKMLANNDVIIVASAGNGGNSNPNYPAALDIDNIVSVLALDPPQTAGGLSKPASYTTYGKGVTIGAPGSSIISTSIVFDTQDASKILYEANGSNTTVKEWTFSGDVFKITKTGNTTEDIISGEIDLTTGYTNKDFNSFYVYYEGKLENNCYLALRYTVTYDYNNQEISRTDQSIGSCWYDKQYMTIPAFPNLKKIKYELKILSNTGTAVIDNVKIKLTQGDSNDRQNGVIFNSGTSMAAPYVTGAITAAKSVFPTATGGQLLNLLYETSSKNQYLQDKVIENRQLNLEKFIEASAKCYIEGNYCLVSKQYPSKNGSNGGNTGDGGGGSGGGGCSIGSNSNYDMILFLGIGMAIITRFRRRTNG